MKATHSEEYFRNNWEMFIKKSNKSDYMNFEDDLKHRMSIYAGIPTEALKAIEKIEAKKIIENAVKALTERANIIKDLEAGKSSLGYTTRLQEVQEMHRIIQRFEFNCLQLSDFKKAHN